MKRSTGKALVVSGVLAVLLALLMRFKPHGESAPLFLAPMIDITSACIQAVQADVAVPNVAPGCTGDQGSAAQLVEETLSALGPRRSVDGRFELGYTLQVPLLKLLKQQDGGWVVDQAAIDRVVRTLRDVDRPVILYLFSTHFASGAPIESVLAKDPANLLVTQHGVMSRDKYYTLDVFPWTFVSTDNSLTHHRIQVIEALRTSMCTLPESHLDKLRGITLLGELHHLFPGFESGMRFDAPYEVSDYSVQSIQDFRRFLAERFGSIGRLNALLGANYPDFAAVSPPGKDIRRHELQNYWEHIDSYAHGTLPVAGWLHLPQRDTAGLPWIRIYRNGELAGRVPARLSRQDVLAALPEVGSADVGWRFDLNFTRLLIGLHRLDIFLEQADGQLAWLGERRIAIMDASQQAPSELAGKPLPAARALEDGVRYHIDLPEDHSAYFYNPLVPLWHAFRQAQVVRYLQFIRAKAQDGCLAGKQAYVHQIIPFANPGWDAEKFAVQDSLTASGDLALGASLYGEASYGSSFLDWLERTGPRPYGVTEFHPLRAMTPKALDDVWEKHRSRNARFVSFFLEPLTHEVVVNTPRNLFAFDPGNQAFGSDQLYGAVHVLMTAPDRD